MTRLLIPWRIYAGCVAILALGSAAIVAAYPSERLLGAMFEADQDLEQALVYYRSWAENHPKDFDARWHTATLELATARPSDAIATLESMAADWPGNKAVLEKLVDVEDSLLHVRGVIPRLDAIAEHYPDDLETLRRLADHQRWFGNSDALLDVLERVAVHPEAAEERMELADILLANRHYRRLIHFFESLPVSSGEGDTDVRRFVAEAHRRMGQAELASETLLAVLGDNPGDDAALAELAELWSELDRPEEVENYVSRAIAVSAEAKRQIISRAYADASADAAARGDLDRAIALARRRIATQPQSLEARIVFAELHGDDTDKVAAAELRELAELRPTDVAIWRLLAERLSWIQRTDEAAEALDRAIALAPSQRDLQRERARLLLDGGRVDAAIDQLQSIAQSSHSEADLGALFDVAFDEGRYRTAASTGARLRRPTPRRQKELALSLAWTNNCSQAMPSLRALAPQFPDDQQLWRTRRDCAIQVGDPEDALVAAAHLRRRPARRSPQ